jgi:hypothetical protein
MAATSAGLYNLDRFISLRPLRSGQLAPRKGANPDRGEDSAQEQNDLPNRQAELTPGDAAARAQRIDW